MDTFINLTPHPINLIDGNGPGRDVVIPISGIILRLQENPTCTGGPAWDTVVAYGEPTLVVRPPAETPAAIEAAGADGAREKGIPVATWTPETGWAPGTVYTSPSQILTTPGYRLVVSLVAALAMPERGFYWPYGQVRNADHVVIGCRQLAHHA